MFQLMSFKKGYNAIVNAPIVAQNLLPKKEKITNIILHITIARIVTMVLRVLCTFWQNQYLSNEKNYFYLITEGIRLEE